MTDESTDIVLYDPAIFPTELFEAPEDGMRRIAERFMKAETVDELFQVLEGNNSKGMVGRTVEITGVQWTLFEADRGLIPNAIVTATDLQTGEIVEFATTGGALVLHLRRAQMLDVIPFKTRLTTKKTRSGFDALNFARV